jgi:hypothetical protein
MGKGDLVLRRHDLDDGTTGVLARPTCSKVWSLL